MKVLKSKKREMRSCIVGEEYMLPIMNIVKYFMCPDDFIGVIRYATLHDTEELCKKAYDNGDYLFVGTYENGDNVFVNRMNIDLSKIISKNANTLKVL